MATPLEIRTEVVNDLEGVARDLRLLEAKRLDLLIRGLTSLPPGEMEVRAFRAESALALGISEARTDRLLGLAFELNDRYPATLELLRRGRVDIEHARVIADEGAAIGNIVAQGVTPEDVAEVAAKTEACGLKREAYEKAVLGYARELTPNRLRPVARRLAEQWASDPIEVRQAAETKRRRVTVVNMGEGMAELRAYIPAVLAYGLYDHLTRVAKSAKRGSTPPPPHPCAPAQMIEPRRLDELRADAFFQLLSSNPVAVAETTVAGTTAAETTETRAGAELQGRVQLILTEEAVAAFLSANGGTLAGASAPRGRVDGARPVLCELEGYGPVSNDDARALIAGQQGWDLVTVRSSTGEVLAVDRYQPSRAMKRLLAARDQHCRFPGCMAPTFRSELDHTFDAALGGATATNNLAHLCRGHHSLKGNTEWTVKQEHDGVLVWKTPTGKAVVDRPPNRLPERCTSRSPVRFEAAATERAEAEGAREHPF